MASLILVSPLQGWCAPLEEAPDEVFAGKMLGDGVAIDPTAGVLHAPCDGEVVLIPASRHAITLRAKNGAEVLVHIGIDTVGLGGEGFEVLTALHREVQAGEPLLAFDMDLLARRAKSLMTPVIVTNGERISVVRRPPGGLIAVGDFLLELTAVVNEAVTPPATSQADAQSSRKVVIVSLEHGIHARPAALLAQSARQFESVITLHAHHRKANARSAIALMSLGVRKDDEVTIHAQGADADAAGTAMEKALGAMANAGLTDAAPAAMTHLPSAPAMSFAESTQSSVMESEPGTLRGVLASAGLAVGVAVQLRGSEIKVTETGAGIAQESEALEMARATVNTHVRLLAAQRSGQPSEVLQAHLELLDDPLLVDAAEFSIAQGKSAGYAWRQAIRVNVEALKATGDARLAERAADLLDLESQVLRALTGESLSATRELPTQSILLAHELLPSQLMALDASRIAGICTSAGGPTSHVAILAATMGIPALVAAGAAVLQINDGTPLILDAEHGLLRIDPGSAAITATERDVTALRERRAAQLAMAHRECRTADGLRIEVFANIGSVAEAKSAVAQGAEGCGLLRTEFLFLDRQMPPDASEQLDHYQQIATAFGGRPVVIRTLDAGGDKPIAYLPLPHEDNPALGLRGVRTSLWKPEVLRTQLNAVSRVLPHGQCRLLLPMITGVAEVRQIRAMVDPDPADARLSLGVMIETPAAALMAAELAREADFFSIGTNDLTQYTLAMDRGHPQLAAQLDALHPAVLRLIAAATQAAREHDRPVAVCGGLASDLTAVPILIGLGVTELSVVPALIPQIKALIGTLTLDRCKALAQTALRQESAAAVRLAVTS